MNSNYSEAGKKLFICCTPLQGIIARRIIEMEGFKKEDCVVFYYTSFDSEVYRNYYKDLMELCSEGLYYVWKPNFPIYVLDAKKFFKKFKFQDYYFASIDSIFVQLALSTGKKYKIYTFDDGTANIVAGSNYLKNQKISFKRSIFFTLGNRFSSQKIRKNIVKHYTIFPELKNIIDEKISLSLFQNNDLVLEEKKKCTVILGTVYEEIFINSQDLKIVKKKIIEQLSKFSGDIFYIPHPRELYWNIPKAKYIKTKKIAEEVVLDLFKEFSTVDLVSFGSTAQLNLALTSGVNNFYFKHEKESDWLSEVRVLERKITSRTAKIIDLNL